MVDYALLNKIKSILAQKGISQRQFAEMLGKDETAVSRWFAGKVGISASSMEKIEEVLDVNLTNFNRNRAKTALITGVTGQDGSFLAEFLLDKGYDVHGTIRRSSVDFRERIAHLELDFTYEIARLVENERASTINIASDSTQATDCTMRRSDRFANLVDTTA